MLARPTKMSRRHTDNIPILVFVLNRPQRSQIRFLQRRHHRYSLVSTLRHSIHERQGLTRLSFIHRERRISFRMQSASRFFLWRFMQRYFPTVRPAGAMRFFRFSAKTYAAIASWRRWRRQWGRWKRLGVVIVSVTGRHFSTVVRAVVKETGFGRALSLRA